MKKNIFSWLLFTVLFPSFALSQAAPKAGTGNLPAQNHPPLKGASIVSFQVETEGEGALQVLLSDGSRVIIPREKGRFAVGGLTVGQSEFSRIQLADDRRHIGWLAGYMICQQSYPCPAELVIYRPGRGQIHIAPPYGIFWRWKFQDGGRNVAVQSGYPHGDKTGIYALYDSETGREIARFSPMEGEKVPAWAEPFQRTE